MLYGPRGANGAPGGVGGSGGTGGTGAVIVPDPPGSFSGLTTGAPRVIGPGMAPGGWGA
jgi:hypothetical protein